MNDLTRRCCWLDQDTLTPCGRPAEWEIWAEPCAENQYDAYDHVDSCTAHVGLLLSDAPHHRVTSLAEIKVPATSRLDLTASEIWRLRCLCEACQKASVRGLFHASDCAVHNPPASPVGPCNCGVDAVA